MYIADEIIFREWCIGESIHILYHLSVLYDGRISSVCNGINIICIMFPSLHKEYSYYDIDILNMEIKLYDSDTSYKFIVSNKILEKAPYSFSKTEDYFIPMITYYNREVIYNGMYSNIIDINKFIDFKKSYYEKC